MSRWLITGGAGFIGSHLAARLTGTGDRVTVLDNLSTGRLTNLQGLENLRFVEGDLADRALLSELAQEADGIFHLAARVSVPDCIAHWRQGQQDNLIGSMNVFDAACLAGAGRETARPVPVVYASSAAVYGDCGAAMCQEDQAPRPISPYGADKLGVEHQARAFAHVHRLPSFGLRFFNIYGPRQSDDSPYSGVIARFVANLRAGRGHEVLGDGQQSRDFLFVGDAVEGMHRAMSRLQESAPAAEVSNLCTGRSTSLMGLIAALDSATASGPAPVTHNPPRMGDIRFSCGDPTRMTALLGAMPVTPLPEGLAALWAAA